MRISFATVQVSSFRLVSSFQVFHFLDSQLSSFLALQLSGYELVCARAFGAHADQFMDSLGRCKRLFMSWNFWNLCNSSYF